MFGFEKGKWKYRWPLKPIPKWLETFAIRRLMVVIRHQSAVNRGMRIQESIDASIRYELFVQIESLKNKIKELEKLKSKPSSSFAL